MRDLMWNTYAIHYATNLILRPLLPPPILVLFDVVPAIKFKDAIELISLQPVYSTVAAWKRMQDIELMHMRYALEAIVLALGSMQSTTKDINNHFQIAIIHLKELGKHMEALENIPRKIFMVNLIVSLLHIEERNWSWKEALTVLRAAPSKLLNLCMQRAKYDIGEEAVNRFSLSLEDKATLGLMEWVDETFRRASAQIMLAEIYPGGSPKTGFTYWDQIHEVAVISVTRRIIKRLQEYLEQETPPPLREIFSGENPVLSAKDSHRQGQRERALAMLHQMIDDAHKGKRQFLSGKLHNLARAVADEESEPSFTKGEDVLRVCYRSIREVSNFESVDTNANDPESDIDDPGNNLPSSTHESNSPALQPLNPEPTTSVFLSFDWENEGPYEKAVDRLIDDGKYMDALALSDRYLRNGASDKLLQLIIESGEVANSVSDPPQGLGSPKIWSDTWQYCMRLKNKELAASLALKYLRRWDLDAALEVLTMCSCHLSSASDPLKNKVLQTRQALQRYKLILCADDQYNSWLEVEAEFKEDPEGLALRLAGKGVVSAALEVAESAGLSIGLRRELQGRQLVKLLTADPLDGGGPAEASRFLSSLHDSDDALPVAMGAMQLLPDLRSKELLVHFFLKRRDGNLVDAEVSRLNSWALGLRVLSALPLTWRQKCSSLHGHPHLVLEVLLMRKQLQSASQILKEFPTLRNINTIFAYAAKAIADEAVRSSHRYESAPDLILFKSLLSLCFDESVSAKGALDLCINQMKNVLSSQQLPENTSMETIGRAYHATEAFVQGLVYAKSLLRKFVGGADAVSYERNKDTDDASSDAGSSSVGSQSTDELSEILSQAEIWLGRAELLQSLLGSGIAASLDDIADKEASARLRDRLIVDERYSMAVYTCKKCKIDSFPVWNAWGHALVRMEHFAQARVKFKQALQLLKEREDHAPVILEIISTLEGGPPVDVSSARSMYEHLAKSAPTILDDSLSADSYLNVLYMPSTFPRSERSRRFGESTSSTSSADSDFDDGPRSNLDSVRYLECVNYLHEYAPRHLLNFIHFNYLYKFQVIKGDQVAAGLCCIQLFMNASSLEEAIKHMEHAKMHFEEGLSARHKAGEFTKVVTKGIRGKSASEKLTEDGLLKLCARVSIQVEVAKAFNDVDGPQWKHSLFGNPNDPETFRRRCEIAETLAEKNFDLAFQVIYQFSLPAVDIYAAVAASLAERKRGGQLTEFFKNIKGTIDDDDWDQVLGAAINVYANKHKERPDRLIDMLTSNHRKVLACVVCGRLKSAFQIASRSGSVADVQYVAHQALHANALPVLDMCKQWLAQYM
ncbi:unnamed protein product [Rhodiola kirilowii]